MVLLKNIELMKSLLRTGWIRAGVPKCDIESLADHSWAVSILTYFFCLEENSLRKNQEAITPLNTEKAVLYALFHDFPESEYMDIDKSMFNLSDPSKISDFLQTIEEGAIKRIINQLEPETGASLRGLIGNHDNAEFRIARVADHIDVLNQATYYTKKHWITPDQADSFQSYALKELKGFSKEFSFLNPYLVKEGFIGNSEE
ncbi:MAG: HD domain-containing protein [Candidatus Hodarchaeales archaeon]|jgi:5'-deoxynucleotidase YfbR-like HD superfamily hydrolase